MTLRNLFEILGREASPDPYFAGDLEAIQNERLEEGRLSREMEEGYRAEAGNPSLDPEWLDVETEWARVEAMSGVEEVLVEELLLDRVARETVLRVLGPDRLEEIEYQRDVLQREVGWGLKGVKPKTTRQK
jgi:hypothetical protein